jgi:hypothetical protein
MKPKFFFAKNQTFPYYPLKLNFPYRARPKISLHQVRRPISLVPVVFPPFPALTCILWPSTPPTNILPFPSFRRRSPPFPTPMAISGRLSFSTELLPPFADRAQPSKEVRFSSLFFIFSFFFSDFLSPLEES